MNSQKYDKIRVIQTKAGYLYNSYFIVLDII